MTTTIHTLPAQRTWLLLRAPSAALEWPAADAGAGDERLCREEAAAALLRRQRVAALLKACAVPFSSDGFAPLPSGRHGAAPMLRGADAGGQPPLRYQWRRDGLDLAGADQDHLVLPAASPSDDGSSYSVLISDDAAARSIVRKPAVVATLRATGEPPWRWADLAAQLRGQPDLLATVFAAFKGRCTRS